VNIWRGCTYRVEPPSDRNALYLSLSFKATSIVHHELGPLTYRRLISMNLTHAPDTTETVHASRWTLLFIGFHPDHWTCHEPILGLSWTAIHGLLKADASGI
jgi:hypothetical protein